MKNLQLIIVLSAIYFSCQSLTIKGKVINEVGIPIPKAIITLKRTGEETVSDNAGLFTFKYTHYNDTIVVTQPGCTTVIEPNNERGEITVILNDNSKSKIRNSK